jgi:small-conductance mechanosensitive channel
VDRLLIVPLLARGNWRGERAPASRIIHQVVNSIVVAVAVMTFGAIAFGWDIDKFLAGSAVVSIVIGLALQETLGNFFSGMVMHASRPFAVGDWVGMGELEGRVVDMSWRAVTIRTSDDDDVIVPNGSVARDQIINYHSPSPASARSVEVGLDYDIAPEQATAVLKAAAQEADGVLVDPAPVVYLKQFGDSSILYRIKFWIDKPASHNSIEHRVRSNAWYRLRQHGFSIPFPIRMVEHVRPERKREHHRKTAIEHRCKAIAEVVLFSPLSPEQIQAVAAGATDVLLGPGQVLFHQGEAGDSLFIIRRGEVEVLAGGEGPARHRIATLKRGDFFGEMSALTGQPRSATIAALTDLCVVEICKDDLAAMFTADPSIMEKMSQIVVDRNLSRAAALSDAAAATPAQKVSQQSSMLQRMRSFFGRGRE